MDKHFFRIVTASPAPYNKKGHSRQKKQCPCGKEELTLCRLGSRQRVDSQYVAAAPEFCYRILRYLCENGVQPEIWQDVVTELTAVDPAGGKGGAWCEQ